MDANGDTMFVVSGSRFDKDGVPLVSCRDDEGNNVLDLCVEMQIGNKVAVKVTPEMLTV